MNVKTLVINGLIAALYVVVSIAIAPFGFTNIQFRISEMFNHLVVFDKRYFFGIVIGVFIVNLNSPLGWYDLVFGVAHSVISLGIIIILSKYIKDKLTLLFLNTIVFTFNMFIIAFALNLALELPFWFTWLTTAIGEFGVLLIGIPLFFALHKRLRFDKLI
ncbi:QueT transporter family protein [Oceanobacillus kimchii]|uniref:QueT transporter family protein n=1 Tax=Oceanobacillus kimchii TaxID=746691 RepID=UPI0003474A21|nr:QueT transporter family protein [Oceanobacillus kimchii]